MPKANQAINNSIYDEYGDRWHTAYDDPIALLRAESKEIFRWTTARMKLANIAKGASVLDIGCGGGFLTNPLATLGFKVTGLDISPRSLEAARNHDETGKVKYIEGDAYSLPFPDASFDVVTSMDFLEHVDQPRRVVAEAARVLKPGGMFYFHTFNRNFLAHFVIIKLVEWFVKNTPKDMHVIELFIKPEELQGWCEDQGLKVQIMRGIRPDFFSIPVKNYLSGIVPESLKFKITSSLLLSYIGEAQKKGLKNS